MLYSNLLMRIVEFLPLLSLGMAMTATSCSHNATTRGLEMRCIDSISWNISAVSDVLPMPFGITVNDSVMSVLGLFDDCWLHNFDLATGEHCGDYVYIGQGPGEIVNTIGMSSVSDSAVSIFDANTGKLHIYDTESYSETACYSFLDSGQVTWQAWGLPRKRGLVLRPSASASENGLALRSFAIVDLTTMEELSVFDGVQDDFTDEPTILSMQSELSISPDGKHFVSATVIGGALELFNIENDKITPAYSELLFPLKFTDKNGLRQPDPDPTYGFAGVCATDSLVYAVVIGSKDPNDADKIAIWGWDGECKGFVKTDRPILKLAVSKDLSTAYAIVYGEDIGLAIATMKLPRLQDGPKNV